MKCKLVSHSRQMELPVSTCVSSKKGHRCGACHNASDAKVRTVKQFTKLESNRYFLRVAVSMYLFCWFRNCPGYLLAPLNDFPFLFGDDLFVVKGDLVTRLTSDVFSSFPSKRLLVSLHSKIELHFKVITFIIGTTRKVL